MGYGYDINQKLNKHMDSSVRTNAKHNVYDKLSPEYLRLLHDVREKLTAQNAEELSKALRDETVRESMRGIIARLMTSSEFRISFETKAEFDTACERIYNEIMSFGEITQYLESEDVEEINCDGWDLVKITTSTGMITRHDVFSGPEECLDTTKRLARLGGVIADAANPVVDSDIAAGKRISVILPPVAPETTGAYFALRQQKEHVMTRGELLGWDTANEEIIDYLQNMINYGVSTGFAGPTGSGKTTDINHYGWNIKNPETARLFVIEEGSRELNFDRIDKDGNQIMSVQYTKTRSDNGKGMQDVSSERLLKAALRFKPSLIVCAEMRGAEAWDVLQATQTGHPCLTSFHASNNAIAYIRYKNMALQAQRGVSNDALLEMCYTSIPMMCYKKQMIDGRRRYLEITEAYRCPDGEYLLLPIFKYYIKSNEIDRDGKPIVKGEWKRINYISNSTAKLMQDNGAPIELIREYAKPDYDSERDSDVNGEYDAQRIKEEKKVISTSRRRTKGITA